MWVYHQSSGRLCFPDERVLVATGYAGHGEYKNDPASDHLSDRGPLPKGIYHIESPRDTDAHGPYVLPLLPDPSNEMHGRSGFLCHGDSVKSPGTASLGCMIFGLAVRKSIWASNDHKLQVVA